MNEDPSQPFAHMIDSLVGAGFELRETHISWVFLGEDFVFKIKKPVDFGFLDFSTAELRRGACDAELVLNRRLATDVYLDVVPVLKLEGGYSFDPAQAADGERVAWAVKMRRLADADRADVRLGEDRLRWPHLQQAATALADFHAGARCDAQTTKFGSTETIETNLQENFAETCARIQDYISKEQAEEIERWQLGFAKENAPLFKQRQEKERVRDGHGDLRLEHLYLSDAPSGETQVRFLDCIEFNERFRYGDVCSDVAFLAMDLAWHGHADLAERFLAAYARAANDYDLYPLVDFYESYRAFVRGKISSMAQAHASPPARKRLAEEARRYFLLALASERRAFAPNQVVAVGGIIAAGKSTIADGAAATLCCPVVDTDRTRKYMLGVAPTEKVFDGAWSNAYGLEFTAQVYDEVLRRASVVLASGRSVILDASFRSLAARAKAKELATKHGVPFTFIECTAPHDVLKDRLRERAKSASVSDGRLEIFDDFVARWEDVSELPPDEHLVLNTNAPLDSVLAQVHERLA